MCLSACLSVCEFAGASGSESCQVAPSPMPIVSTEPLGGKKGLVYIYIYIYIYIYVYISYKNADVMMQLNLKELTSRFKIKKDIRPMKKTWGGVPPPQVLYSR